jgi:hypothetical protein
MLVAERPFPAAVQEHRVDEGEVGRFTAAASA